jgi:flagellar motility protein MotE (MotC chaperone)
MAYKFDPVLNPYVDPKAIEISKTLNDRYAQNFAVNDALNTALRDMQFAPFENDTALAKELRKSTDAKLQQIAERGDYENMTFPLHSIAKETGNMLKPLADNYSRYQTTLTDLSERLKKADINSEQYDLYKSYMTRGYKGLELDEYGRPKEGTAFSAPTLYNDPKIMDRITKRLEILHTQETGNTTSNIQRDPTTGDLVSIEQGGTITKINPELVQKAVDAVMQESDVKMYLDQMGTMKTYKYSDAVGGPDKLVEMRSTDLQNKLGQLNNELNSGKYKGNDKLQIQNAINSIQSELNSIGQLSTPEQKLNYVKNSFIEDYQQPIREYASLKGGIYKQTSVYKVDNITAREKEKRALEWADTHPELLELGQINASQWGGKDITEKLQNINGIQQKIADLEKTLSTGIENGTKLSDKILIERRQELESYKNDRLNTEAQIKEAARKSISYSDLEKQDPTLVNALADYLGTKDVGTIYLKMQQIFDNTGDQDYLNFEEHFNSSTNVSGGEYELSEHLDKYYSDLSYLSRDWDKVNGIGSSNISEEEKARIKSPSGIFQNLFEDKLNEGLKEVKISPIWTINRVPGINNADTRAFTTAFDKIFLNNPLSADKVYKDSSGNQVKDIAGATIVQYGMPTYGTKLIKLNIVQGTDKTPKTVYMDIDQITSPEIKQIYNSNSFRLASRMTELGNVSQYDLKVNTVNTQNGEYAKPFTLRFNDTRGNGKPLVTVLTNDGKPVPANWFTERGLEPITHAVDPNSQLFKDFIELPILQVN